MWENKLDLNLTAEKKTYYANYLLWISKDQLSLCISHSFYAIFFHHLPIFKSFTPFPSKIIWTIVCYFSIPPWRWEWSIISQAMEEYSVCLLGARWRQRWGITASRVSEWVQLKGTKENFEQLMAASKSWVSELGTKSEEPKIKMKEKKPRPTSFISLFWLRSALWSANLIICALVRRGQHINKPCRLLLVLRLIFLKKCLLTNSTAVTEQRKFLRNGRWAWGAQEWYILHLQTHGSNQKLE